MAHLDQNFRRDVVVILLCPKEKIAPSWQVRTRILLHTVARKFPYFYQMHACAKDARGAARSIRNTPKLVPRNSHLWSRQTASCTIQIPRRSFKIVVTVHGCAFFRSPWSRNLSIARCRGNASTNSESKYSAVPSNNVDCSLLSFAKKRCRFVGSLVPRDSV